MTSPLCRRSSPRSVKICAEAVREDLTRLEMATFVTCHRPRGTGDGGRSAQKGGRNGLGTHPERTFGRREPHSGGTVERTTEARGRRARCARQNRCFVAT